MEEQGADSVCWREMIDQNTSNLFVVWLRATFACAYCVDFVTDSYFFGILFFVSHFVWSGESFALFSFSEGWITKRKKCIHSNGRKQWQWWAWNALFPSSCHEVADRKLFIDGREGIPFQRGLWTWWILFQNNNIILNKFGVNLLPCSKLIFSLLVLVSTMLRTAFSKTLFFS